MSNNKQGARLRATAAEVVDDVVKHGRSLDAALASREDRVAADDRSLLRLLSYGVLRHHWRLMSWVNSLLNRPLKARDSETRSRLGGILARFLEIEKSAGFDGWTEAKQQEVVAKYVKQLQASVEAMKGSAVAESYAAEIALLEPYLPKLLDEAATRELVAPLAEQARGLGQFMGLVMKSHKGKVDPRIVRAVGQELGLK